MKTGKAKHLGSVAHVSLLTTTLFQYLAATQRILIKSEVIATTRTILG